MADGFTGDRRKRTTVARQEAASTSVDTGVSEATEEDVEIGLGKTMVIDPVTSHISSVLNMINAVTTRRSVAAT